MESTIEMTLPNPDNEKARSADPVIEQIDALVAGMNRAIFGLAEARSFLAPVHV